jgi:hypothetical protein
MSSSGTALAASRLGDPRHDPRKLEDLGHSLRGNEIEIVPSQRRALRFPLGSPVPGRLRRRHLETVQRVADLRAPVGRAARVLHLTCRHRCLAYHLIG